MIKKEYINPRMNTNMTFGVLTDTEVILVEVVQGKRVLRSILLPLDMSEPGSVLEVLWQAGLTAIWVMPATRFSRNVTRSWLELANNHWMVVVHADPSEPTRPVSALFWPKGNRREERRLTLSFPEYAGWGWTLTDSKSLLATVTYLQQALARPVLDAPNLVAHQLFADLTRDQPLAVLRSSPVDLQTLHDKDGKTIPWLEGARETTWMRPLTLIEQRQRYLHKYTHVSLELEACKSIHLGTGTPQYSPNGRMFDGIRPGIWHVRGELVGSVFDGKRLPSCLDRAWMSTPQVACCRDIGYQIHVEEGHCWPQSHELLTAWATTLWQAAESVHTHLRIYRHAQARANTSHTIKKLVQSVIALFAQEETTGGWSRPDWWAQIIGRRQATLFAHLVRLVRKGTMPVLVDGDAFWVVSNDPNPLTAVPGLVTAPRWRGYTLGYEVPLPLSREVRDIFRTAEHSNQMATALDILASEAFP